MIALQWTKQRPTVEGLYLKKGDFVSAVNATMYNGILCIGGTPATNFDPPAGGWLWCGPLQMTEPDEPVTVHAEVGHGTFVGRSSNPEGVEPVPDWAKSRDKTRRFHRQITRLTSERDEARRNAVYWMGCNTSHADAARQAHAERDEARAKLGVLQGALRTIATVYPELFDNE